MHDPCRAARYRAVRLCSFFGGLALVGGLATMLTNAQTQPAAPAAGARAETRVPPKTVARPTTAPAAERGTGEAATPSGPSFAIRAGLIHTLMGEAPPIVGGALIVRDGRIAAVLPADRPLPADLPVLDFSQDVICPGFVAIGGAWVGPHAGKESVSGLFRAADAVNIYGDNRAALARGITTAHFSPGGHRLVSGAGAVAKLAGPPERRMLRGAADIAINFGAFQPPTLIEPPFYASSDVAIAPAVRQRPETRVSQLAELEARIAAATGQRAPSAAAPREVALHWAAFAKLWNDNLPLRLQARRAADIRSAVEWLARQRRTAYVVVGGEAARLPDIFVSKNIPAVVRIEAPYRSPGVNLGGDPEAYDPGLDAAARLAAAGVTVALAGAEDDADEDPRFAAALAVRGGLEPRQALAAITRAPAEILGLAERLGTLTPGRDADFLVLSGEPTSPLSVVRRTYVGGEAVFDAERDLLTGRDAKARASHARPLVIHADNIWVGNGTVLKDASILVENGRIAAVGQRVPQPPAARVIHAGAGSYVTPGFIDAHGHLGLNGDATAVGADVPIDRAVGWATREFLRVAQAGVTTVLLAPYRVLPTGGRMAAIKTSGQTRAALVTRAVAGVKFSWLGKDPLGEQEALRKTLDGAKKYDETWKKYEKELEDWKKNKAAGVATTQPKPAESAAPDPARPDPITGKWNFTVSGGPIPEPVSGSMSLRLNGDAIEGRMSAPNEPREVAVSGRLAGDEVTLDVDQDTPFGKPRIVAKLDREDHMSGSAKLGQFSVDFDASRIDKTAVDFRVSGARRGKSKDGRPTPPKRDENLEPLRTVLAGRAPVVVEVDSAGAIAAALKLVVDEFKLALVLLNADDAPEALALLGARKDSIGVVVPPEIVRRRERREYAPAVALAREGLRVAFQSNAEDAASALPLMGLFAVQRGLGGDQALRALTIDAARMYKLDDRLGTIEAGKDADLLIFNGHPLDAPTRLEQVIVGGQAVPQEAP